MFIIAAGAAGALLVFGFILAISLRTVAATNEVHIVQSSKRSTAFGKDAVGGNTYWSWPSWVPFLGVKVIKLPVSNFAVPLKDYEAYDKGRLPFVVDVMSFFRVEDAVLAAQRISDFGQLQQQLIGILQGACRTILAKSEIEQILEGRAEFGTAFTAEVNDNLKNWGVTTVKNIEFMDIRDSTKSEVIANIMAKKKSEIEMQSRVVVASNTREAQLAEIAAQQEVQVRAQEAKQQIGIRTAQQEQQVGIATEKSKQQIAGEAAVTAEKDMEVKRVNEVKQADIRKAVAIVAADQQKQTQIIGAEAQKQTKVIDAEAQKQQVLIIADGEKGQTVTVAEGRLTAAQLNAQGIEAEGKAKGAAEQAILMAPVVTQIELAREIGANDGYQKYLIEIRTVEANQAIGVEQAKALDKADVKIIANTGSGIPNGMKSVMDLFTSSGGTNLGAAVEAFTQTEVGKAIVGRLTGPSASK